MLGFLVIYTIQQQEVQLGLVSQETKAFKLLHYSIIVGQHTQNQSTINFDTFQVKRQNLIATEKHLLPSLIPHNLSIQRSRLSPLIMVQLLYTFLTVSLIEKMPTWPKPYNIKEIVYLLVPTIGNHIYDLQGDHKVRKLSDMLVQVATHAWDSFYTLFFSHKN